MEHHRNLLMQIINLVLDALSFQELFAAIRKRNSSESVLSEFTDKELIDSLVARGVSPLEHYPTRLIIKHLQTPTIHESLLESIPDEEVAEYVHNHTDYYAGKMGDLLDCFGMYSVVEWINESDGYLAGTKDDLLDTIPDHAMLNYLGNDELVDHLENQDLDGIVIGHLPEVIESHLPHVIDHINLLDDHFVLQGTKLKSIRYILRVVHSDITRALEIFNDASDDKAENNPPF